MVLLKEDIGKLKGFEDEKEISSMLKSDEGVDVKEMIEVIVRGFLKS